MSSVFSNALGRLDIYRFVESHFSAAFELKDRHYGVVTLPAQMCSQLTAVLAFVIFWKWELAGGSTKEVVNVEIDGVSCCLSPVC